MESAQGKRKVLVGGIELFMAGQRNGLFMGMKAILIKFPRNKSNLEVSIVLSSYLHY